MLVRFILMKSNVIITPFPRLIARISIGSFGYNLALITAPYDCGRLKMEILRFDY